MIQLVFVLLSTFFTVFIKGTRVQYCLYKMFSAFWGCKTGGLTERFYQMIVFLVGYRAAQKQGCKGAQLVSTDFEVILEILGDNGALNSAKGFNCPRYRNPIQDP